jgi:hypothetical protein
LASVRKQRATSSRQFLPSGNSFRDRHKWVRAGRLTDGAVNRLELPKSERLRAPLEQVAMTGVSRSRRGAVARGLP